MKESHQSVSNSSIHESRNVNDDKAMPSNSIFRTWRKKMTSVRMEIRNSAYPVRVESLWILVALVNGLHFADKAPHYGLTKFVTGLGFSAE